MKTESTAELLSFPKVTVMKVQKSLVNLLFMTLLAFLFLNVPFARAEALPSGHWSDTISAAQENVDYRFDSASHTFSVYTGTGLAYALNQSTSETSIQLMNDLDLSAHYWDACAHDLYNVFDGGNHTIRGIIPGPGEDPDAFLAYYASNATFRNLNLHYTASADARFFLLSANTDEDSLTIQNCTITGSAAFNCDTEDYYGLLVGYAGSNVVRVSNLQMDIPVTLNAADEEGVIDAFGALFSYVSGWGSLDMEVSQSRFHCPITVLNVKADSADANYQSLGSMIGVLELYPGTGTRLSFSDCTSTGDIQLNGQKNWNYVGGMIGGVYQENWKDANASLLLKNCTYSGTIRSDSAAFVAKATGGLLGYAKNLGSVQVENCHTSGALILQNNEQNYVDYLAGLLGFVSADTVKITDTKAEMSLQVSVPVVAERPNEQCKYGDLYSVGGLVGYLDASDGFQLERNSVAGNISLKNQELTYLGGAVAYCWERSDASVTNCTYTGDILLDHVTNIDYIGGLMGQDSGSSGLLSLMDCGVKGKIQLINNCTNMTDLAGVLGRSYNEVNMVRADHTGDILVDGSPFNGTCGYVGGLIGEAYGDTTIKDSSSKGDITLKDADYVHMVGGLIGYCREKLTILSTAAENVTLSAEKKWMDDGKERPSEVLVQLYADGTATGQPISLNENNHWTYTWADLPGSQPSTYHQGKILVEDCLLYAEDGAWIGGLVGDYEDDLEISFVYQQGDITVRNCTGTGEMPRLVVGGWTGGTGSDDLGTSVTNTVAQTTNSYCIADITIEKCSHLEKGLYAGGLTGLVKKPGSSNNFDTFYSKGTLKVQQAPGAVGYLFGDMVKDGSYQQAYYHEPSAAASNLADRLSGNSTFEAAVEEGFQPYQGEAPLQFGQSKTYTVKELVSEGYEASYVTAGNHTIITNTRTKQPDTPEIVPPKTGDSFGLYTVIALLFLSLGALLTLAASRKSRS